MTLHTDHTTARAVAGYLAERDFMDMAARLLDRTGWESRVSSQESVVRSPDF